MGVYFLEQNENYMFSCPKMQFKKPLYVLLLYVLPPLASFPGITFIWSSNWGWGPTYQYSPQLILILDNINPG